MQFAVYSRVDTVCCVLARVATLLLVLLLGWWRVVGLVIISRVQYRVTGLRRRTSRLHAGRSHSCNFKNNGWRMDSSASVAPYHTKYRLIILPYAQTQIDLVYSSIEMGCTLHIQTCIYLLYYITDVSYFISYFINTEFTKFYKHH